MTKLEEIKPDRPCKQPVFAFSIPAQAGSLWINFHNDVLVITAFAFNKLDQRQARDGSYFLLVFAAIAPVRGGEFIQVLNGIWIAPFLQPKRVPPG